MPVGLPGFALLRELLLDVELARKETRLRVPPPLLCGLACAPILYTEPSKLVKPVAVGRAGRGVGMDRVWVECNIMVWVASR